MTEPLTKSVGGIRLADKPLHFGHFVGTFAAHVASGISGPMIYIIKDTEPYRWNNREDKVKCIVRLTKAAMAVAGPNKVEVVLSSTLLRKAWTLQCVMADCLRYRSLVGCHFQKEAIRAGTYQGQLKHFLFPLEEAVVFTFLQAEIFFSNLDNERIIRYVRDCQVKLDKYLKRVTPLVRTQIMSYPALRFLPGEDYNRMASNNSNVVPIDASEERILELCGNAVKLGRYFRIRPDLFDRWQRSGTVRLEDDFLAAILMKIFDQSVAFEGYRVQERGRETIAGLQDSLQEVMLAQVGLWRERVASYDTEDHDLYDVVVAESERLAATFESYWDGQLL